MFQGGLKHGPQAYPVFGSGADKLTYRRVPDSPGGIIDDSLQGLLVVRVHDQAEVRDHVLDLFPLVKRQTAVNLVRDAPLSQRLFQDTGLGVGTIQDSEISIREFP